MNQLKPETGIPLRFLIKSSRSSAILSVVLVGDNHLLAKLRCPDFQPIASRIRQRLAMTRAEPKFPLSGDDRQDLLDDCLSFCGTVAVPEPPSRAPECRDPCDRKFLELALAGQADALMTGDGDLLALAEEFCVPMSIDAVQSDSAEFVRGLNEAPIDEIQRVP